MTQHFSMLSFVAGIIVGTLLVGTWFLSDTLPPLPNAPTTTFATGSTAPESGAVAVSNQPAGQEVVVESVTVPPPGVWVAVREIVGNTLGNVLGAARVTGPRTSVSVSLLRATEPNLPYAIELYRDDGDGLFDLEADSVYVDFTTSAPVIARFMTTE